MRTYSRKVSLTRSLRGLLALQGGDEARPPADTGLESARITRLDVRLSQDDRDRIVADYGRGESAEDVARAHGLSKHGVLDVLHREDASVRRQPLNDAQLTACERLYATNMTIREVAEALRIPKTTVQDALRRRGVETRPAHRRRSI